MRPVGDIYLDLEELYDELIDDHGSQKGDLIYWLDGHIDVHRPDCIEEYVIDGSHPGLRYGPNPDRKAVKKQLTALLKSWSDGELNARHAEKILKLIERSYK